MWRSRGRRPYPRDAPRGQLFGAFVAFLGAVLGGPIPGFMLAQSSWPTPIEGPAGLLGFLDFFLAADFGIGEG